MSSSEDKAALLEAIRTLLYRLPPDTRLEAQRGPKDKHAQVRVIENGETTLYTTERPQ